jgi:hypothetical protein
MDETRIDDRILSAFSDDSACVGDVPSSPTRSPLNLTSLSSESLGSPYLDGSPNTTAVGLGIPSVSSVSLCDLVWDELLRELRQELFADIRSELLCSKQETAVVQQENATLRQSIEELESVSVRAPGSHTFTPASPSVSVLVPGSHTSTPASPANTTLDHPAEYLVSHLIDLVISLT